MVPGRGKHDAGFGLQAQLREKLRGQAPVLVVEIVPPGAPVI